MGEGSIYIVCEDPEYQISGAPQQQCSAHCKYPHRFMDREEFGRVVSHIRKMSLRFAIFMESFAARPPHLLLGQLGGLLLLAVWGVLLYL
jgi:hypothetical protein